MLPGLHRTMPLSTLARSVLSLIPTLSPAIPSFSSFLNISTPVTTALTISFFKPTISTSSLLRIVPCSIRPVATVPIPVILKTSSTDNMKSMSILLSGSSIYVSTAFMSFTIAGIPYLFGKLPLSRIAWIFGVISAYSPGFSAISGDNLVSIICLTTAF